MAHDLARIDDRIFVFSFEKGERYGEAYRDIILKGANSEFVAQIGDDDLWYPDHLAVLAELLRTVDLAALLQVRLMPGGAVSPVPRFEVLSEPAIRHKMLSEPWNFFGPSEAGYRLQAYRALPVGWSPAPLDLWTDLFMWRKFLRHPGLTYASRWAVTSLKFGADDWQGIEPEELAGIIASEAARLRDPLRRAEIGIRKRLVSAAPGSLDAAQMVSGRRSKGISSPMRLLEWLAMSLRRVRSQP